MAGRVWRFPFDDEIATLSKIDPDAARELVLSFPATDDIHPPLSYALFCGLRQLGLSDAGMRLCSLAMTALALLLCQLLVLRWIAQRDGAIATAPTRLVAVFMFGLMPLALSQGDALRWYPVFALLSALFVTLYLAPREGPAQLWSSVALGLAASIDFSAVLLVPPLLIYRAGGFQHAALVSLSCPGGGRAVDDVIRPAATPRAAPPACAVVLTLATSISAIANIKSGTHPFKRNSVVPYQSIFDFMNANAHGSPLVLSTDPVVPWLLRDAGSERCAGYFFEVERYLASGRRYDSVFVVFGHSDQSVDEQFIARFKKLVADVTAGRSKVATLPAGRDEDAALKSRLSGVPLETTILTVDHYR